MYASSITLQQFTLCGYGYNSVYSFRQDHRRQNNKINSYFSLHTRTSFIIVLIWVFASVKFEAV